MNSPQSNNKRKRPGGAGSGGGEAGESDGEKSEGEGELVVDDPSPVGSASSYDRQVHIAICTILNVRSCIRVLVAYWVTMWSAFKGVMSKPMRHCRFRIP